jgi:hypothetical protein
MQHHLVGTLRPEARPDQGPRGLHPRPSLHVYTFLHAVPFHAVSPPFTVMSHLRSHLPHPHTFRVMVINSSYSLLSWKVSLAVRQPFKLQSRRTYQTAHPTAHALTYFRGSWAYLMSAFRSVRLSARSSFGTRCPKSNPLVVIIIKCIL